MKKIRQSINEIMNDGTFPRKSAKIINKLIDLLIEHNKKMK